MHRIVETRIGNVDVCLPEPVGGCLKGAMTALQAGDGAGAVEWTAAGAICDIQQFQETFLSGAAQAAILCDLYEAAFAQAGIRPDALRETPRRDAPLRVAYVISQVAQGQGPARRLTDMVEMHDRSRFKPHVFVAEELTRRTPALRHLDCPARTSWDLGRGYLERMRAAGVEPILVPTTGSLIDAGRWLTDRIRSLRPDIAVFIASVASPIQAIAAFSRCAPIQINQNVAVPLPLRQFDGMIYHNARCAEHDAEVLAARDIEPCIVTSVGTDTALAARTTPIDRSTLGIPTDAVLLVTASNKLQRRMMHAGFARDLARFMQERPEVWWLGVGGGPREEVERVLAEAGARERARFAGGVEDVRPYIKASDIYVNEYPEGGGNTVLEAMACSLPVAAMRAGDRHTESVGAGIVGERDAVMDGSPSRYWSLVDRWVRDPRERARVGRELAERVEERFNIGATCRQYEDHYERLARVSAPVSA